MAPAKNFRVGDLVWGKMRNFPPWPARVLDPPLHNKVHLYFFGTHDHAFLLRECVMHHSRSMLAACKRKKKTSLSLRAAVLELQQSIGSHSKKSGKPLNKHEEFAMRQRLSTVRMTSSQLLQLKLERLELRKRQSLLKTKVPRKKVSEPRASRPTPSDLPYNLRSRVVPEPVVEEEVEEDLVCRACNDSEDTGATDKKVTTPCCSQPFHMSCLLRLNCATFRPICLGCRSDLNIALSIKMTEKHKIAFSYEFCERTDRGRWNGIQSFMTR